MTTMQQNVEQISTCDKYRTTAASNLVLHCGRRTLALVNRCLQRTWHKTYHIWRQHRHHRKETER